MGIDIWGYYKDFWRNILRMPFAVAASEDYGNIKFGVKTTFTCGELKTGYEIFTYCIL